MKKTLIAGLLCGICLVLIMAFLTWPKTPQEPTAPEDPSLHSIVYANTSFVLSEVKDALGAPYSLNKNMETTERNGVTYHFEPSISKEERISCIQATEAMLARLDVNPTLQIAVYTPSTYNATFTDGNTIYTCLQDWKSPEFVTTLLYSQFGEYCHFGAIYGYANYLCRDLYGMPLETLHSNQHYAGTQDTLDLNLLCFSPKHNNTANINSSRLLANTFVSDYIQKNSEKSFQDLLTKSGTLEGVKEFTHALVLFYANRGIFHVPSELLFRQGGKNYTYIVKGQYATFYMEQSWIDQNTGKVPMYHDGVLQKNYSEIKYYFTTVLEEMAQYQTLFSLYSYNNDLKVFFANFPTSSDYVPTSHSIQLPYINSLSLHYIESLVGSIIPQDRWAYNGTLAYFSYYYDYYGNTENNYVANMEADYPTLQHYRDFRQWLGRDIDIATDFTDLVHYYAYSKGYTNPNNGGADSFIAYLIHRFGEEQVIDILCQTHSFGEYSFDELVANWSAFLNEKFSDPVE